MLTQNYKYYTKVAPIIERSAAHLFAILAAMFIYNVTVNVADEVHQQWLQWMKEVHVGDVMKTGCFVDSQILKVLHVEDEGHTYSVQYKFVEMTDMQRYQKEFAAGLQAEHKALFGDKCVAFRTLLQIVN
jgi:hypothetical protein